MSSLSIVQGDLPQSSDMIGTDRSSILGIERETAVHENTKETTDSCSIQEEKLVQSSDDEDSFNDDEDQPSEPHIPELQYSREVLLQLKELPISNVFPSCLEKSPKSILAQHLINKEDKSDKKSFELPTEDDRSSNDGKRKQFKKKNAVEKEDPGAGKKHLNVQDRLKKEEEIVLSPQRRSFNTGCSGSFNLLPNPKIITRHRLDSLSSNKDIRESDLTNEHRKQRLDSLAQSREPRDFSQLSREANNRRLNRGRLMNRDSVWEPRDSELNVNYGFDKRVLNNSGSDRRMNYESSNNDRERYGFFDRKKHYNDDHPRIEKEPEWFSAGPTSQYDVIELQGFDDLRSDVQGKKQNKKSDSSKKKESAKATQAKTKESQSLDSSKSNNTKNNAQKKINESVAELKDGSDKSSEVKKTDLEKMVAIDDQSKVSIKNASVSPSLHDDLADVFLNFNNLIVDDVTEVSETGTSKFSRWFQPEPTKDSTSNKNQTHELFSNELANRQCIDSETTHNKNSDISMSTVTETKLQTESGWPVFNENIVNSSTEKLNTGSRSVLEKLLMVSPSSASSTNVKKDFDTGFERKMPSVEELEAHLRKPQSTKKSDEDVAAFKRLFNQSKPSMVNNSLLPSSTNPVSAAFNSNQIGTSKNLTQLQQQKMADLHQHPFGFQQTNFPVPAQVDSGVRLQQSQQPDMLKMFGTHSSQVLKPSEMMKPVGVGGIPNAGAFPQPVPIESQAFAKSAVDNTLQKPEAQVLLYALRNGQITASQLLDQNYPLQPGYKEVLSGVMKVWLHQHAARQSESVEMHRQIPLNSGVPHGQSHDMMAPRPADRFVPQMLVPPPMQPEPTSQLGVPVQNSFQQRIPSPQELIQHTQNIMQTALIKRRLEEQRENYKRRQEMWRARSPADESSTSPQLLSTFTPTSVLRQQKRKTERDPAGSGVDHLLRYNTHDTQQQLHMQQQQKSLAHPLDMFQTNKGRPIIKKSVDSPQYPAQAAEPPYHLHPAHAAQLRSQTPAPNAAQNFFSGFALAGHPSEQQQQQSSAFAANRNAGNLASATACLQGLLLDNSSFARNANPAAQRQMPGGGGEPMRIPMTSQHSDVTMAAFNRHMTSRDEGGPLSRWFPTKLIEDGLAGKLPDIPKTQNMLSVEDIERVQTVHN